MGKWLINVREDGNAFIFKRQYYFGIVPKAFQPNGFSDFVCIADRHDNVFIAAVEFIYEKDNNATIAVTGDYLCGLTETEFAALLKSKVPGDVVIDL